MADSNKPPEVLEKIVTGRMRKFYEEICLTEQEHMVEEGNPKVSKALKELGLAVKRFESSSI
jgi:elongation factor Ts